MDDPPQCPAGWSGGPWRLVNGRRDEHAYATHITQTSCMITIFYIWQSRVMIWAPWAPLGFRCSLTDTPETNNKLARNKNTTFRHFAAAAPPTNAGVTNRSSIITRYKLCSAYSYITENTSAFMLDIWCLPHPPSPLSSIFVHGNRQTSPYMGYPVSH